MLAVAIGRSVQLCVSSIMIHAGMVRENELCGLTSKQSAILEKAVVQKMENTLPSSNVTRVVIVIQAALITTRGPLILGYRKCGGTYFLAASALYIFSGAT